jgi:hypothetical protein
MSINDLMNSTALPETFDPETQEGSQFDVLPVGEYVAQVIDAGVSAHKIKLTERSIP